jgi:hypothetical protein
VCPKTGGKNKKQQTQKNIFLWKIKIYGSECPGRGRVHKHFSWRIHLRITFYKTQLAMHRQQDTERSAQRTKRK